MSALSDPHTHRTCIRTARKGSYRIRNVVSSAGVICFFDCTHHRWRTTTGPARRRAQRERAVPHVVRRRTHSPTAVSERARSPSPSCSIRSFSSFGSVDSIDSIGTWGSPSTFLGSQEKFFNFPGTPPPSPTHAGNKNQLGTQGPLPPLQLPQPAVATGPLRRAIDPRPQPDRRTEQAVRFAKQRIALQTRHPSAGLQRPLLHRAFHLTEQRPIYDEQQRPGSSSNPIQVSLDSIIHTGHAGDAGTTGTTSIIDYWTAGGSTGTTGGTDNTNGTAVSSGCNTGTAVSSGYNTGTAVSSGYNTGTAVSSGYNTGTAVSYNSTGGPNYRNTDDLNLDEALEAARKRSRRYYKQAYHLRGVVKRQRLANKEKEEQLEFEKKKCSVLAQHLSLVIDKVTASAV